MGCTVDYSNITLFSIMKTKLAVLSERQSVLAQNIANASTPGYKAKDVTEPDFKALLTHSGTGGATRLQPSLTHAGHISGHAATAGFSVVKRQNTSETNPNGNNVVIEDEMSKIAATQAEYQQTINMYGKMITMFKTAIGNPNSGG